MSCSVIDVKTVFASSAESFAGSVVTKNLAILVDPTKLPKSLQESAIKSFRISRTKIKQRWSRW